MRTILRLIVLFFAGMVLGLRLRGSKSDSLNFSVKLSPPPFDEGKAEPHQQAQKENGPEAFIKYQLGIRTRADQQRPNYPKNYQWKELQKMQHPIPLAMSKRTATQIQSGGNGVLGYIERGPGNVPGRTRGLIVDPDDGTNQTWFAGSASGGIWKTTNAGINWQWLTPGISNLATTALLMAASNHNVIYAGTGEGFGNVDGVSGDGIFKSADRGVTWTYLTNSEILGSVNRIAVDPTNEDHVLAATNTGIYSSTDGGTSWIQVFNGEVIQDLRPNPNNFSELYASQNGIGILKSTDGGMTWNLSNTGMSPSGRLEIAVSPVNPSYIAASAEGSLSGVNSDLYISKNGGATWYLVNLTYANQTVDYLSTQGWYDNTVAFSPYNPNVIYVGGVSAFQVTLGSPTSSTVGNYTLQQNNSAGFLSLVNFGANGAGGVLQVGGSANHDNIQVLFGPGISQKAHRFLVPAGATGGVPNSSYTYQDYVDVSFQVWDLTMNTQLMVSFRDQDRNGVFDLLADNTTSSDATQQSREYVFINDVPYSTNPSPSISTNGGEVFHEMYFFWPELAPGATWGPNTLPSSNLLISYQQVNLYTSTVNSVVDPYDDYDGKNSNVHPDQHNIYPMANSTGQTYQLLLANDGGVFLSGISTSPGTTQGEWTKVGNGYNTGQFYGADKKPGAQEYVGGLQDNSTYFTPSGTISSSSTYFVTNPQLAGDGFEVLWHTLSPTKMIGGAEFNYFSRSLDGGKTWAAAFSGLTLSGSSPDQTKFPFISKLAASKQVPDILYTVGSEGVWKSTNFGGEWTLTPINSGTWGLTSFADVEVSRANANVVWAGSGMGSGSNLFVSTDAGATFRPVPNPTGTLSNIVLGNITRIATHPTNQNIAFALFSFAKTAKILMTQDLGQTWHDISGFSSGSASTTGFPDVAVYSLYVRPDNVNVIWAGTEIGIVESLDGGATWALNSDFPSVAVWDMKGQDTEVVIATHGRGIWTADVAVDQNSNFPIPIIVNSGTSPESRFVIQAQLPVQYDSVQIMINSQVAKYIPVSPGLQNIQIKNASKGNLTIQLIGYIGNAPVYSNAASGVNLTLSPNQQQYSNYFITANNFYLNGLAVQSWGSSNTSLQSAHNYIANQDASGTLLVPIIVSSGNYTSVSYQDVALVVPGTSGSVFGQTDFNDYVITEATKDGITWMPVANGYNASANSVWQAAIFAGQNGAPSMSVNESFDLKTNFVPGDTLLLRFRLHAANELKTAWGWSIDNLSIQTIPAPEILASGTSPQAKFEILAHLPFQYDSVEVVVNGQATKFVPTDSGTYTIQVGNAPVGPVNISLVGHGGSYAAPSAPANGISLALHTYSKTYYDPFNAPTNWYLNGLSIKDFGVANTSLQSAHSYPSNQELTGTLLMPIIVSSGGNTTISYQDVALVKPGAVGSTYGQENFNDYVVVEGTKDGLKWTPIANGYNASENSAWQAAYNSGGSGTPALFVTKSFDLKSSFKSGDTLLVRFRLHSNPESQTAWGWSIDNLFIQQNVSGPEIIASGTSPQSKFVVGVHLPYQYDSVEVSVNSQMVKFTPPDSGVFNIKINGAPTGNVTIQLAGYFGGSPIFSAINPSVNFSLLEIQQQYFDYFTNINNFYLDGWSLLPWGSSNSSMQTSHPYPVNQDVSGTLLVPIIISNGGNTSISYQDVAIVVPGASGSVFGQAAFNDYVVVEGTKDGIAWLPIGNGYNASANFKWLATYNAGQIGMPAMTVTETFDLKNKFNPLDTLLIRFRLHATNENSAAWGWSVDNLYIQQTPTGIEPVAGLDSLSLFPNPAYGKFNLTYSLPNNSSVMMNVWDMSGRSILVQDLGLQNEGVHQLDFNFETLHGGTYIINVKANQNAKSSKIIILK